MSRSDVSIPFWKPHDVIKDNARVLVIGGSDTGKSTIITHLLYLKKFIPNWWGVSSTEKVNGIIGRRIPPCFICEQYSDKDFLELVTEREKHIAELVEKYDAPKKDPNKWLIEKGYLKPMGIVIDDQGVSRELHNSELFAHFMTVSRHYNVFIIVAQHSTKGLGPTARDQFDWIIACREPNRTVRRALYEHYFGLIETFPLFNQILDNCTENYEVLVLHKRSRSNELDNIISYWKADLDIFNADWKCGSKRIWRFYKKDYNPREFNNSAFEKFASKVHNASRKRILKERRDPIPIQDDDYDSYRPRVNIHKQKR